MAAVEEGWFLPGMPTLDIGCGQGDVVAWLVERKFPALGIDIAQRAIDRARNLFGESPDQLEFQQHDICTAVPTWRGGSFTNLIDRGCFHQIPNQDLPAYARNVARASSSGSCFLLFVKAFRDGQVTDQALETEREHNRARVEKVLGRSFTIERIADTFLDAYDGRVPEARLPGLVVWMRRK